MVFIFTSLISHRQSNINEKQLHIRCQTVHCPIPCESQRLPEKTSVIISGNLPAIYWPLHGAFLFIGNFHINLFLLLAAMQLKFRQHDPCFAACE